MNDLLTTAKYWWSVEEIADLFHVGAKMVRLLLKPHRGKCHLARRGRHPRLCLWVPIDVVRQLDRERRGLMSRTDLRAS